MPAKPPLDLLPLWSSQPLPATSTTLGTRKRPNRRLGASATHASATPASADMAAPRVIASPEDAAKLFRALANGVSELHPDADTDLLEEYEPFVVPVLDALKARGITPCDVTPTVIHAKHRSHVQFDVVLPPGSRQDLPSFVEVAGRRLNVVRVIPVMKARFSSTAEFAADVQQGTVRSIGASDVMIDDNTEIIADVL